jgi:hypothetical protein
MAFGVGSAQATTNPVAMTFDDGTLKLGGSDSPVDIVDAAHPAVLTADVCTDTAGGCAAVGDFTVTPGNFSFDPFTATDVGVSGQNATVDLTPLANVTGHYDFATGSLTTNASDYSSSIVLSGLLNGNCTVSPISLALSTTNTTPFVGDAFDSQVSLLPPVHGVIDASWATLPAPTGDAVCGSVLSSFTNGPGSLALANGAAIVCPGCSTGGGGGSAPATPAPVVNPPAKKKCKKSKKRSASAARKSKCKKKKEVALHF